MTSTYIMCLVQIKIIDASDVTVLNYPFVQVIPSSPEGSLVLVIGHGGGGAGKMITPNACHA